MTEEELLTAALFRFEQKGPLLLYRNWVSGMSKDRIGKEVGAPDGKGYLTVHFCGKQVKVHQISYLMYYKRWPTQEIDHKDRNILNNNPLNLVESTSRNNQLNRSNNVDKLYLYYKKDSNKFYIKVRDPLVRKSFNFGTYKTKEDAEPIRLKVEKAYPYIAEAYAKYKKGAL